MDKIIEKWDEILNTVKQEYEISDVSFDTWIRPLEVFAIEGNTFREEFPEILDGQRTLLPLDEDGLLGGERLFAHTVPARFALNQTEVLLNTSVGQGKARGCRRKFKIQA